MKNSDGKINEAIFKVKLFVFFRHSLFVIRLLLPRQLRLPILWKKMLRHSNSHFGGAGWQSRPTQMQFLIAIQLRP
jgi:hypothetical protein